MTRVDRGPHGAAASGKSGKATRSRFGAGARWGLAAGALFVGLVVGEIGLRVLGLPESGPFLQEFRGERFKLMAYDSDPADAQDLDLSDAAVRARFEPSLLDVEDFRSSWPETPHAVAFHFNAFGFREVEFRAKLPGTERIVVVGDSFTVGHGLPEARSYPRQLETLLRRSAPPSREVYNLGRGDTDLPAIVASAGFALARLEPDVLVYGYFLNDAVPSQAPEEGAVVHDMLDAGWVDFEQTRATTRIGQAPRGVSHVVDLIRRFSADRDVTRTTIDWYRSLHRPAEWAPTLERIAALAAQARRHEVRFVFLILPLPYEISGDYPFEAAHADMAMSLRRAGVEVVDPLEALRPHPDEALRLHPRDRHPSPLYARIVAERLAETLSRPAVGAAGGTEFGIAPPSPAR